MSEDEERKLAKEKFLLRQELVKRLAPLDSDPVQFASSMGVTPDPWQADVLRWTGKRLLLNCSRQAGKSTTTSILALHRAMYSPKSLVLLISPSLRQSAELFRKVTDAIGSLTSPPKLTEDNKLSLTLENGSRIVSLPSSESTIRGFSAVSLIIEDEAAYVDDELNAAIRPMLAVSGGQMILMSTPKGRRGHFFEAWERGGEVWERVQVTAHDVPRIDTAFLEEEKRSMGERFRQEYECQFINAATGRVYHSFDETTCVLDDYPQLRYFVLGIDYGVVDDTAFTVLGWRDNDPCIYVVESYRLKRTSPSDAAEEAKRLEQRYRFVKIVGDQGGMGKGFVEEALRRFSLPIEGAQKNNKPGYIALLNGDLARGRIKVSRATCKDLIEEWLTLPWAENHVKESDGFDNHCADATLYAWRASTAYHNVPAESVPQPGTKAAYDKLEEKLERQYEERFEREKKLEWWQK